jgi:predicted thioesterase
MARIPAGAKAELKLLVTGEFAVDFLDNDDARVLATPFLIGYLEMTSRNAVKDFLEPGYDTVGTHVDVKHLAATPLGMSVSFHAEVTGVDERRIQYRVWAEDEVETIAEGTHERFIINVDRFADRVIAKARAQQPGGEGERS